MAADPPATTRATSQPTVTLKYGIYLARREVVTTIAPDRTIEQRLTNNKRYGDGEGTWTPTYVTRRGTLTPDQARELASLLKDVEALPSDRFPEVPDGGSIALQIGERTLRSGAGRQPPAIAALREAIDDWAKSLPVVEP